MPRKEAFTVAGDIRLVDGVKRFIPLSPEHMKSCVRRLTIGERAWCTFFIEKPSRSRAQLAYYFVLIGYMCDHTGYTDKEMHEIIMVEKFGTKAVRFNGKTVRIRETEADIASFPKAKMAELIDFSLQTCSDLNIIVPTKEELGYISN